MTGSSVLMAAVDRICSTGPARRQKVNDCARSMCGDVSSTKLERAAGCMLALARLFEYMGKTSEDRTMIVDALLGPLHRELRRRDDESRNEKP